MFDSEQSEDKKSSKLSTGYFQAPDLVFDLPLAANEKLVLLYFLRRADKAGRCFPSVARIASDCGFKSENTARKAVRGLESSGLVHITCHNGRPNYYTVTRELYEVILLAKEKYNGSGQAVKTPVEVDEMQRLDYMLSCVSSPTPSKYEDPPSNNEPPPLQNLNPKEYTYKENTTKVDTEKKAARKKREEEGSASSSSEDGDSKVTLSDVLDYMSALSPEEKRRFDNEARKLGKPGEPDPDTNLWQKRLLRVRYLERLSSNPPIE